MARGGASLHTPPAGAPPQAARGAAGDAAQAAKKKNSRNKIATPNLEIVEKFQLEQKTGEAKNWIDIL